MFSLNCAQLQRRIVTCLPEFFGPQGLDYHLEICKHGIGLELVKIWQSTCSSSHNAVENAKFGISKARVLT